jgi:hypothetical protein
LEIKKSGVSSGAEMRVIKSGGQQKKKEKKKRKEKK